MPDKSTMAPGGPGAPPHWAPSSKDAIGTANSPNSPLWFTIRSGIVTETFFPSIDCPAVRDFGLLVADGKGFFSEEKIDTEHKIAPLARGVPGWTITNTCCNGRYKIVKTIVTDPTSPTLVMHVRFEAKRGSLSDYKLYALLAPHLGDEGANNSGHVSEQEGKPVLVAEGASGTALALCCSSPFTASSCGYVGKSDGWQDVHANCRLTRHYDRAENGNIALTGEIDPASCKGEFVLVVGFGANREEALGNSLSGIHRDFEEVASRYRSGWSDFQNRLNAIGGPDHEDFGRMCAAVLKAHDAKGNPGGIIASLSIPWGQSRGDSTHGGYHLIWPRDQVEAALALLAAGDSEAPRQSLRFLIHTQQDDGHWPQNMWANGRAYWDGLQLDETALPILLADALRRGDHLDNIDPYPMVKRAADFLVSAGPCSPMDRWEENAGYSPFTLATTIAALLAAADFAEDAGDSSQATWLRSTADGWNGRIEDRTYVSGTELASRHGVDGYYVRISPPDVDKIGGPGHAKIKLKNRPPGKEQYPASEIVSPDALALVRYGLRKADDPRIINTIKVIDGTLKTETETGPVWHRYTLDGYGETAAGAAFQGAGIGRGWPLLTGERAHYEIAYGNKGEAERLLDVLKRQTSSGGMLPEQIWEAEDIPDHGLVNGCPSGSAMPLVWAHAEALKLIRSLHDGKVWGMPPQTVARFIR